jgi:hypothetical protein
VPRDEGAPSLRNSLETDITFSRMAADASLCASGKSSDSARATARFTVSGTGEECISRSTVSNVSSTVSKKWATVATCLQSCTLGQSRQSQDLSDNLTI